MLRCSMAAMPVNHLRAGAEPLEGEAGDHRCPRWAVVLYIDWLSATIL